MTDQPMTAREALATLRQDWAAAPAGSRDRTEIEQQARAVQIVATVTANTTKETP